MTDADYENMSVFSCGETSLDEFFRFEVKQCVERRYLAAYCAISSHNEIIAAFTLMNDALMIDKSFYDNSSSDFFDDLRLETDNDTVDFFKSQSSYPAINIGHLGILVEWQSKGIGTDIIDLITETFTQYRQAGCQFLTVDALNNSRTLRFYYSNGFYFQTNKDQHAPTRRMYRIL